MAVPRRHLKVAVGQWIPWCDLKISENGTLSVSGVAVEIFEMVAQKLKYTYTYVLTDDGEWGRKLPNGTWTGLVGMCVSKRADMALGPLAQSYMRNEVVDYSSTLYFDHQGIFLPRPRLEKDFASFTKPLANEVWISLCMALGISIIFGFLLNYFLSGVVNERNSKEHQINSTFESIWIFSNLVGEPATSLPTTHAGRILLGTWLIGAFIIDTAYVGVLTSILALPIVTVPVDSLEDLVEYGKIPWALEEGASLHHLFSQAEDGILKTVYDQAEYVYGCYKDRKRIKYERIAIFCDFLSMRKVMNDDFSETGQCNYYMAKKPVFAASMNYVFQKNSPILEEFEKGFYPVKEAGLVSKSVLAIAANATSCLGPVGKESGIVTPILSLVDLAGIFILWAGGMLLGSFLLGIEVMIKFFIKID